MQNNEKIKKTNKKFFNLWASFYDWFILKPWLLSLQKKTVNYITNNHNASILDIGCGTGDSLILLSKKGYTKLFGVDISENMLKIARKKLEKKAVLKLGDVEKLPFKNNLFNYVISTEAFHHFPDPNKALQEIYRVLKKKGILLIVDINFYLNFIHRLFKILEPGHVKIYNEKEFRSLFEKNNLKVTEQKRISWFTILTIGKK